MQSVLIEGSASTECLLAALTGTGRKTRLIGQGSVAGARQRQRQRQLRCARRRA
jgi:hypothetical protein